MRKNLLMAMALVIGSVLYTNAQTQLINGNMELWDNAGTENQEPQQWNSFKTANCTICCGLCGLAQGQRVERSTDVRPGSTGIHSARIYSTTVAGVVANGNLTTGQIQMGSTTANNSSNHNKTITTNAAFNTPLTAKPDSIVFWAKYQPANNSTTNTARMRATVHDNSSYRDPGGNTANEIGRASINYTRTYNGSAYVWQRFAIPFDYTQGTATTPSYILITFTTNDIPGGGANNDQVWIDDVELKYIPITITTGTINPLSYTVTPTNGTSISIPFTKTGNFPVNNVFTAQLSDASGSFASPVNLGTLASANAGTITGTIPAGTPSGTGYRVRVISSTTYQTATENTNNITINLGANTIAPVSAQTIVAGTNGNALTVTETVTATSREWKFATAIAGPYSSFSPTQTGATYTPNFANAGTYYVVCESSFGSLTVQSNAVTVTVVKNQITPAGSQSLLVGSAGTTLSVTESNTAASREWLYSMTSGGPYLPFSPTETGTTYQPLFASAGTYHVVCKSIMLGLDATSNEVVISVGNLNINTGTIVGSPFEFSATAPDANINVPYTVSGAFNAGNTFTAQLSDENGSFANPTDIGTTSSLTSGSINAAIPSITVSGTNYLIRVIGSNPATLGSDNGTALVIDQFNNTISPITAQTFVHTGTGNPLTVSESQTAASREWKVSTVSGGPYVAITPAQTGVTFTPSSPVLGTFYAVCASTNQHGDEVISNEVMITVENGATITTSAVAGSPFYVSPSANNQVSVSFTSDVIFSSGNVFTAQLSDASGNFVSPQNIGTLNGTTVGPITATIPNAILDGTGYRIRVISSNPTVTGAHNGNGLSMINFSVNISPVDTQYVATGTPTTAVSLQSTHPNPSVEWKFRTAFLGGYNPFNPPITGNAFVHTFTMPNIYQVVAEAVNNWNDTLETPVQVVFVVSNSDINEVENNGIKAFMNGNQFVLDITNSSFVNPNVELINMAGQVVYANHLQGKALYTLPVSLASGVYTYRISENGKMATGKISVL